MKYRKMDGIDHHYKRNQKGSTTCFLSYVESRKNMKVEEGLWKGEGE
jgi:hypothetical protein